jgi:hypothetical protein
MKHALLLGLLMVAVPVGHAIAVETPPHKTVVRDGDYEVRDDPALVVAEVTVDGDQRAAANRGFRLLGGDTFGDIRKRQDIAITAPVTRQPAREKIAMTAPVA